jgi:flavodoxin
MSKILILHYSRVGNTGKIAEHFSNLTERSSIFMALR